MLNFLIASIDAKFFGYRNPIYTFFLLISESICLAGNILM